MVGVDPTNYTLRELDWMAMGKAKHDWSIHSQHLALHANANRDPKKQSKAYQAFDFNPTLTKEERRALTPKLPFSALKGLINNGNRKRN